MSGNISKFIHEEIVLTEEEAVIFERAMDPNTDFGKYKGPALKRLPENRPMIATLYIPEPISWTYVENEELKRRKADPMGWCKLYDCAVHDHIDAEFEYGERLAAFFEAMSYENNKKPYEPSAALSTVTRRGDKPLYLSVASVIHQTVQKEDKQETTLWVKFWVNEPPVQNTPTVIYDPDNEGNESSNY